MVDHFFCVHGHFYQPPREDPLTGEIPVEAGAAPYRNWNERIYSECYKPNAQLGNFEHISFNIGPTLMHWLDQYAPQTLALIIEQDRRNVERYGMGNAMAQSYHHTILPLASRLDKETQIRWGIADFEYHYGRRPQGMWLPETAVDDETLEVLAECGIEYTILAPWQAADPNLDVSQPYTVLLSGGKRIQVFFYQQELSTRVSFDPGSTSNADRFVLEVLLPRFKPVVKEDAAAQFLMLASDGELYGHHQKFRDHFLQRLMDGALSGKSVEGLYPGLWLKRYPPTKTMVVKPNTSWSCSHGTARWAELCSCTPNSFWKAPLRKALNTLARLLDEQYQAFAQPYLFDPWELRHLYIYVLLGKTSLQDLIQSLSGRRLDAKTLHQVDLLLQAQYERQRMFTSCGWFFDDFDRIEPRNNVAYAAQAAWLSCQAVGMDVSEQVIPLFAQVKSWRTGLQANQVYCNQYKRAAEHYLESLPAKV